MYTLAITTCFFVQLYARLCYDILVFLKNKRQMGITVNSGSKIHKYTGPLRIKSIKDP